MGLLRAVKERIERWRRQQHQRNTPPTYAPMVIPILINMHYPPEDSKEEQAEKA